MAQLAQAETSQFTTSTCRSPRRSCATRRSRSTHGPRSAAPGVWRAAANPPLYRQRFPLCRRGTAPRPPREPRRGWAHRPRALPSRPLARRLGVVVPFGVAVERPTKARTVLKGVIPGIASSDRVVIWGGNIWNWLDPLGRFARSVPSQRPRRRQALLPWRAPPEPHVAGDGNAAAGGRALG